MYFYTRIKNCNMPLLFIREINLHTRLGLWKIEETKEELKGMIVLTPYEEVQFASFKSEIRKKQWLSYRVLLTEMIPEVSITLIYDEYGKPHLQNNEFNISITHSGDYSAVIISNKPVGIDIERLKDRINRITGKFLTPEEDRSICDPSRLEKLYIAWGAKEALYKLQGKPEVEFQRDIFIESFTYLCTEKGHCNAKMRTNGSHEEYTVFYERISDYMLVYALKRNTEE